MGFNSTQKFDEDRDFLRGRSNNNAVGTTLFLKKMHEIRRADIRKHTHTHTHTHTWTTPSAPQINFKIRAGVTADFSHLHYVL